MRHIVLAAAFMLIFTGIVGAQTPAVPAPANLQVVSATEDSITLAWGPSQTGDFVNLGEPKKNQVLVGWGASEDSRGPVTYSLYKDGVLMASGLTQPQYLVTGVPPKVKSFRACVVPASVAGNGPQRCGTFSR